MVTAFAYTEHLRYLLILRELKPVICNLPIFFGHWDLFQLLCPRYAKTHT